MELEWRASLWSSGLNQTTINNCSLIKGLRQWGYAQDFEVLPPDGDNLYRFDTLEEAVEFTKQWR